MHIKDHDVNRHVTRGQFLAASAVGLGAVLAGCGSSGGASSTASSAAKSAAKSGGTQLTKGGTLNVWTWPGYWAPKNLSAYKAATGTTVNIASYQSDDQMYAKLKTAAGADFDIAIPDLGWIPVFSQSGLVQKIDHDRVPFKFIEKSVLGRPEDPNNEYSVPKDYAATGVVYDPTAVGGKINTWHDFLDALSRPGVSGKAEMPSQASEALGVGLWAMGKNWNTATQSDLTAAYNMLKPLVTHLKSFDDFDVAGVTNGSVVMAAMTNANARLAMLKNKKLAWVIPQPQSELILDSYVITHSAPDADQAYSFIDFMLQPKQQITDTVYLGYPLVLPGIQSMVPKNMPLKEVVFVSPADLERLEPLNVREDVQGFAEGLYTKLQAAA